MKTNKLLDAIIFFFSSLFFLSFLLPIFAINTEGIYRSHLVRVAIEKREISFTTSLIGSSSFGVSISSWILLILMTFQ